MKNGDRVTRYRASRFVWGGLALVFLALLVLSFRHPALAGLKDVSSRSWRTLEIAFGVLSALCGVLVLLPLRRRTPTARAGVAAGFVAEPSRRERRSGRHAAAPPRRNGSAREPLALAEEVDRLRTELGELRDQAKNAEEAYRFVSTKLKQTQNELRAYEEKEPVDVDASVSERLAESEALRLAAEARAAEAEGRFAVLEQQVAGIEAAFADVKALEDEAVKAIAAGGADVLAELEERVGAAEQRAVEAERRSKELGATPEEVAAAEAASLRARLARTAARKKRSPADSQLPPAPARSRAVGDQDA